jgi:hypothetical protein
VLGGFARLERQPARGGIGLGAAWVFFIARTTPSPLRRYTDGLGRSALNLQAPVRLCAVYIWQGHRVAHLAYTCTSAVTSQVVLEI